ncbi:MAG TPA: gluconate 2-dehydrogenase subunit 3 family protein [Bryobacteraceae bacterium]|nr:gluconate 2-dehydrogenase subunit 3 family protein [Bryobacteraceae bacterium]
MSPVRITRRHLLAATPVAAAVLAAQQHAHQAARSAQPPPLSILNAAEAREIEAIAAQIIPADDTPGAREAGVIYFIDRALATFDQDKRALYTEGLKDLQARRDALFPGSQNIAGLQPAQQIRLLHAIEKTDFFELVRTHTALGFFGNPSYGGNRDQIGWKLIGFEDRFQFEPPFGYYDAEPRG